MVLTRPWPIGANVMCVGTEHAKQRFIHFELFDPEGLDMELNGRRDIRDRLGSRVALPNDYAS